MDQDEQTFRTGIDDVLDRLKRAHDRGTGCHLTAEMVQDLGLTIIGESWNQDRTTPKGAKP